MTDVQKSADLVVVGAGLVGALLALLVARRQPTLSIVVIEAAAQCTQYDAKIFDPRVVALTESSIQLLREVGVWSKIQSARACPFTDMEVWDGEGTGRIHFSAHQINYPQLGFIVENSLIVSHLQQALSYQPNIQLCMAERVQQVLLPSASLDEKFTESVLVLASGKRISGQLIVGADGAHSHIRALANLQTREWSYGHTAIVTTVQFDKPHGFVARQRFTVDGPLALLPLQRSADALPDEKFCSIVWSLRDHKAEALMVLDDEAFRVQLEHAAEGALGNALQVDKRFSIPLRQRHAIDYCAPGLALVGDAAHTVHPLAGQGVNMGLKDVLVFANELDRALARGLPVGHMAMLRRYQRARKADNLTTMAGMEGFKQLFGATSPWLRWLRNEGLRQVAAQSLLKRKIIKRAMGLN